MNIITEFFETPSDIMNTISFFISIATFIVALRFKKRIQIELDRKQLSKSANRISKEIDGYIDSIIKDNLYDDAFIQKIDLQLNSILAAYTCLSFKLKFRIKYLKHFINRYCFNSDFLKNNQNRSKLCNRLKKIAILLTKEC